MISQKQLTNSPGKANNLKGSNQNSAQANGVLESQIASSTEWLKGKDISEFCMAYINDSKIQMDNVTT